jgi:two-component system sensor histidine kinase UhpB
MLETLEEAQYHQQESSKQLIRSGEQERRRVSRGLYSDVAQRLAGVLVRLQTDLDQPSSGASGGAVSLAREIRAALEGVRKMAHHLRPPELDDLGVYAALLSMARSVAEHTAMEVSLIGDIPEARLGADAKLELFRIIEELVANAARLDASVVTVRFHSSDRGMVTNVTDDGTAKGSGRASEGMGRYSDYLTLHERARHIGGTFQIESGPGRGMHFRLVIPWLSAATGHWASA